MSILGENELTGLILYAQCLQETVPKIHSFRYFRFSYLVKGHLIAEIRAEDEVEIRVEIFTRGDNVRCCTAIHANRLGAHFGIPAKETFS